MKLARIGMTAVLALSILSGGAIPATANAATASTSQQAVHAVSTQHVHMSKKTVTKRTTTNLNVRRNAGVKYKRITTLKKGATVTVLSSKSGWSRIKSGKTTGWVSSKYLKNAPKKSTSKTTTKKAAPKKSSKSTLTLPKIKTYAQAQQYLKRVCPSVKINTVKGNYSYYNPNTKTISIGTAHKNSARMGWVFTHELMHHYQWHGKYKNNVNAWNKGVKNKSIEIQADQMTYHMYGKKNKYGFYTKKPATGKTHQNNVKLINQGKRAGC